MAAISIGVLGLGQMGGGMAERLLAARFPLTVWNRTSAKAEALAALGAVPCASPAAAAEEADALLVSLSDAGAVEAALFGPCGAASTLRPGSTVINTTTVSPEIAVRLSRRLAGTGGVRYLDVALLGNPVQAREGRIRIVVAGMRDDVSLLRVVLDAIGADVVHVGEIGRAAATKLVFNALLGAQVASLAEAVAYGVSAGLSSELLLAAISASGFSSKVMAFRAEIARRKKFEPAAFRAALMHKDLDLFLAQAERNGVRTPLLQAAGEHFRAVLEDGSGDLDAAIVIHRLADSAELAQA